MQDRERVGLLNKNNDSEQDFGNYKNSNEDSNKKKKKYLIGGGIFAVIVIIAIIIGVVLSKKDDGPTPDPGPGPNPGPTPTPPTPENFNPYQFDEKSLIETPNFASGVIRYSSSQEKVDKTNLMSSDYNQSNSEQLEVNTPKILLGEGNQVIKEVKWTLSVNDYKQATFRAEDNLNQRFEAPKSLVNQQNNNDQMRLEMLGISYQKEPFGFMINSTLDNLALVSTVGKTFYLTEKYLEIDFLLPTQNLFGFGERNHKFQLDEGTWTMWASGQNQSYDHGDGFNQNYGVHPFLLVKARNSTNSNEYFGMFFRNTQGQSPVIRFNEDGTSTLSYITIGGNIEVNFFLKGSAKEIIAQYHNFIGKPALPPFWALGFHQNSKIVKSTQELEDKVRNIANQTIPLQSLWLDKQYMQDNTEFTLNQDYKKGLASLMTVLTQLKIKLVPVLGSGFKNLQSSIQVSKAQSANALILNSTSGKPITGKVYDDSVFMDWLNTQSQDIWSTALDGFRKALSFDGLALDLNENTVNTTNSNMSEEIKCNSKQQFSEDPNQDWYTQCPQDQNGTFYLPFIPSKTKNFDFSSLALNATHPESNTTEYDVHSLNGHMQLKATFQTLTNSTLSAKVFNKLRPFAMSRSTFAGSGVYGGHFFGDNNQTFEGLKMYINSILNFNMFGIPFTGGSICGMHNGDKDKAQQQGEICGAWFQVASWVPFAYQNIDEQSVNSDITNLEDGPKWAAINSLKERFIYLRHIYTCLFMSSKNGGSCYDPVYFHFPELGINEYNSTFIVGDAILVQPTLDLRLSNDTYKTFFPPGKWVHLRTKEIKNGEAGIGSYLEIKFSTNNSANAWLREGFIIQQQDNSQVNNTDDLFKTPIGLFANLDPNQHAEGYVFLDNDGKSTFSDKQDDYELYKIVINGGSIFAFNENENSKGSTNIGVNSITIYGKIDNKDVDFACYISKTDRKVTQLNIEKIGDTFMTLKNNDNSKFDFAMMNVIHFGNSIQNINLCAETVGAMTGYKWKQPVLIEGNSGNGTLISDSNFVKSLVVNFSLLATPNGDTVSVTWNFEDQTLASKRFKFPEDIVNMNQWKVSTSEASLKEYINFDDTNALFTVVNPKSKAAIFKLTGLILDNLFNVIESQAILQKNEQGIIGLGEHVGNSLHLEKGVYSMWSRDIPDPVQTGTLPAANLYGTHPFYMGMDTAENWFGVFTRLSSAQDWWIDYSSDDTSKTTKIKTMSTGNSAGEMYFIFAETAPLLVSTYHKNIIGTPVLTPFWALGWNQCRWGYRNDSMLREIYDNYNKYQIPLDTLWSDIDYMENYRDFTFDPKNFAGLPQLIKDLHDKKKHYIPIVDAGIAQRPNQNYKPYDEAEKNGYFITYDKNQSTFTGQVWPNDAAFPDFSQNEARVFWQSQLTDMQSKIAFDGLWLDMNEASNFCNGACYSNQKVAKPVKNMLPYVPTGRDLESKSISLDAYHKGNDAIELDMHSLFGTWEVAATSEWFTTNNKRPMIIERSGFAGIGKYGSRWMGDNWSDQAYMGYSLVGVQAHNIFGIPLVGSDICGFIGDTTPELCARWHVVGSFYPFSRNHNNFQSPSQEPWVFQTIYEGTTSYTDIMIQAIRNKYRLAKYYYTQMYLVSLNGGSFIQPLFFQFPSDSNSKIDLQYNMMIGEALKLGINSDKLDQNSTQFVFPQGATWCNLLYSKEELNSCIDGVAQKINRSSKAYEFDLHLRDGYIVPLQDAENVMSTYDLQQMPVQLHINLRCVADDQKVNTCSAQGKLINDDGETLLSDKNYKSVTFDLDVSADPFKDGDQIQKMTLKSKKTGDFVGYNNLVNLIYIHNADKYFKNAIFSVTIDDETIETTNEISSNRLVLDLKTKVLDLSKLDEAIGLVFTKK